MADVADFTIAVGDLAQGIAATLTDADGNAVDLTGCTVKFVMETIDGTNVVDDDALIDDIVGGEVRYQFAEGETDTEGWFFAKFLVYDEEVLQQSHPTDAHIVVHITRNVARASD